MTGPLVDPQLAEFWDSAPDGPALTTPEHHYDRVELEVAAAFIVMIGLMRHHLAEADAQPVDAAGAARRMWIKVAPLWLRAVVPAITHAYRQGNVEGMLTEDELVALAGDYASNLGDYINETSADSLAEGMQRQLAQKWNEKVAWQRAVAGYGLDKREMRAYVEGIMIGAEKGNTDLVPAGARALVDRALIARADKIGASEAWTASQTGRRMIWLWLAQAGRMPEGAQVEWDTAEDEATCPVCGTLDRQQVDVDQPFEVPGGRRIWAPQAHPGCRCRVRLVVPEQIEKARGDDPYDRDRRGHFARTETRGVRTAETDPAVDAIMREVHELDEQVTGSPYAPASPSPYAAGSPYSSKSPYAANSPYAKPGSPYASPYDRRPAVPAPQVRLRRSVGHHYLFAPGQAPASSGAFYMDAADWFAAMGWIGEPLGIGKTINFDEANVNEPEDLRAGVFDNAWRPLRVDAFGQETDDDIQERINWESVLSAARPAWWEAIEGATNPDTRLTEALEPHDLDLIAQAAGYAEGEDPDKMRDRIVKAVQKLGSDDDSLAAAYADYVVFVRPDLLGTRGEEVNDRLLDALGDGANREAMFHEPPQIFAFASGIHPGTEIDPGTGELVPESEYYVQGLHYHSQILSPPPYPLPPQVIGMQELLLAPLFDDTDREQ